MIDIHSHVLPAVDDGSSGLEQSLQMLKESVSQGVTDIVLTPHYRHPYELERQNIERAFEQFKQCVQRENIPVNLYLGQEIYVERGVKSLLKDQKVLTLNGSKYVLLEFDYVREREIAEIVYELKLQGYVPVVAHIERYAYADIATAMDIKECGGLIQVNAQSIVDRSVRVKNKFIKKLIKNGLVDFVASDLHFNRENYMEKAYAIVAKKYGEQTAEALFNNNAKEIIKG